MNEESRRLWNTKEGGDLFRKMLNGEPPGPEDRKLIDLLEKAEPPPAKKPPPKTSR